jgi:site-specific DNA recombinase
MRRLSSKRPRPTDRVGASYSRYSSDLQDDSSIDQQQRKCRDKAAQDKVPVDRALEFADAAVSGTKLRRDGLDALLAAAHAGRFTDLYFDSLSRLARESVITMPMLKDLVYNCRVRIVSVSEGIDSGQANWEMQASFLAWMHEQFLKALRAAVLRGQEHAVLNDWSTGDWCFGYASEPIPGSEAGRRGRFPRPRMRVIINPDHAAWVKQIFQWFVVDGWKIDRITRELTRLNAPKDHRSTKPGWHHDYVKRALRNEKYVGVWPWGKNTNCRDPLTGQVYQEGRPVEEVAKWTRLRPNLRIVDDDVFAAAQVILDANEEKWAAAHGEKGRFTGPRPEPAAARHLLQGLVVCGACGGTFQVCGANGRYLSCARAKRGLCEVGTWLPRALAEERLLAVVEDHLRADRAWLEAVYQEAAGAWADDRRRAPAEADDLARQIAADRQAEQRIMDAIELGRSGTDGPFDLAEWNDRLRKRVLGRRQKEQALAALRPAGPEAGEAEGPPTREWVGEQLGRLPEVLRGGGEDANAALRRLTGGGVVVREAAVPGRKRMHLVGTFTLRVRGVVGAEPAAGGRPAPDDGGVPVEVPFRDAPPWAALAQRVKDAIDAGTAYERVAEDLKCPPHWVAKALAWWHADRGLPAPDGRALRARLARPPEAAATDARVMELWATGLPMQEIAAAAGVCRDTVTAVVRRWHEARGLAVPDGRHRRRELNSGGTEPVAGPGQRIPDAGPPAGDALPDEAG